MEMQQPLYEQFLEQCVELIRLRLNSYYAKNGGAASFLNTLIITPCGENESYHSWLKDATRRVQHLNQYLLTSMPYAVELTGVSFEDNELNLAYNFDVWIETHSEHMHEYHFVNIYIGQNSLYVNYSDDDELIFADISDQVWRDLIQDTAEAISFGTLAMI